jgi:hypothetical protein
MSAGMSEPKFQDEHIQSLANILSLVAIVGSMDKAAVQRVLITLGSSLMSIQTRPSVDRDMARKLLIQIAREQGEETALHVASDMAFVARAWRPVLDEYLPADPHRMLPYAEIIYTLVVYSGSTLQDYEAFDRFGGPDIVLPMQQLTAALKTYAVPHVGLAWEMVGFRDPPDQALIASDVDNIYLFKAASSGIDLRFSELERNSGGDARLEHDVRIDTPLFAAFVSGLLGDMLYWAARLRSHALPGHEMWRRVQALLTSPGDARPFPVATAPPPEQTDTP